MNSKEIEFSCKDRKNASAKTENGSEEIKNDYKKESDIKTPNFTSVSKDNKNNQFLPNKSEIISNEKLSSKFKINKELSGRESYFYFLNYIISVVLIAKKKKNVDKIEPKSNEKKKEPKLFIDFSEGKINVKNNNKFKLVNNKIANSNFDSKERDKFEKSYEKEIYKNNNIQELFVMKEEITIEELLGKICKFYNDFLCLYKYNNNIPDFQSDLFYYFQLKNIFKTYLELTKENIEKKIKLTKKLKTFIHRVEKKEIQDILILNYFFFVMDLEYEINELNISETLINYYNEKSRSYKNAYIKDNKLLIENSEIIIENIDCYNLDENFIEQLKEGCIDLPIKEGFFSLKGKLTFRELLAKDGNIIYDSFLPSKLTKDILFKLYNIKDSIFSLENIIKLYKDNTFYFPINNKKYAAYTNKECFKVFIDYKIGNNIFPFFTFNEKIKHLIRKAIMIVNIQHEFGHSHKLLLFSFENDDYEDSPLVKIKIDILNDIEIDEAGEVFEYLLYGRSINELNMKEVIYINNLENFSKTLEEFKNDFINLKDRTLKEVLINECKNNSEITEVFESYDQLSEEDKYALENLSFKSGKKHKTLFCDGLENVKFKIGNRKPHTKNKERLIISKFTCDCIFGEN